MVQIRDQHPFQPLRSVWRVPHFLWQYRLLRRLRWCYDSFWTMYNNCRQQCTSPCISYATIPLKTSSSAKSEGDFFQFHQCPKEEHMIHTMTSIPSWRNDHVAGRLERVAHSVTEEIVMIHRCHTHSCAWGNAVTPLTAIVNTGCSSWRPRAAKAYVEVLACLSMPQYPRNPSTQRLIKMEEEKVATKRGVRSGDGGEVVPGEEKRFTGLPACSADDKRNWRTPSSKWSYP